MCTTKRPSGCDPCPIISEWNSKPFLSVSKNELAMLLFGLNRCSIRRIVSEQSPNIVALEKMRMASRSTKGPNRSWLRSDKTDFAHFQSCPVILDVYLSEEEGRLLQSFGKWMGTDTKTGKHFFRWFDINGSPSYKFILVSFAQELTSKAELKKMEYLHSSPESQKLLGQCPVWPVRHCPTPSGFEANNFWEDNLDECWRRSGRCNIFW